MDVMKIEFMNFTGWGIENSPTEKEGLVGPGARKGGSESAMCICSPESQPYPRLHQEKRWPTSLWR